ncbi:hypothetical protein DMENIID0001_151320 [Sergentomyia squamirostris]
MLIFIRLPPIPLTSVPPPVPQEAHLNKIQPNGSAVRAPRPPIRNGSSVSNSSSPPENTPLLSGLNHQHQQYHLQQQKPPPAQQQVPQAAISEMRV